MISHPSLEALFSDIIHVSLFILIEFYKKCQATSRFRVGPPTERRMGLFLFEFSAGEGYIRYAYIACNMEVTVCPEPPEF